MSEVIQINPIVLGGGGGVSTDWFTKLWENHSPTATFASQTINLASGVYDFLLVTWKEAKDANLYKGEIIPKGASVRIEHTDNPSWNRDLTYVSDTSYSAGNNTQNNDYEVPYQIWGIQKNGLAGDVSTLASNCMLSNGDSVEDVLGKGSVSVTADGVKTYKALLNELYALVDTSKLTHHSKYVDSNGLVFSVTAISTYCRFASSYTYDTSFRTIGIQLHASDSGYYLYSTTTTGTTLNNMTNTVVTSGIKLTIYY